MAMLTAAVEAAVMQLHAALDPEEIILFGSRAYGSPRSDSDIDLLLVLRSPDASMETRERRARAALGSVGWHHVDGHVWAYTPEELRQQLRRGSTAVRDADEARAVAFLPLQGLRTRRQQFPAHHEFSDRAPPLALARPPRFGARLVALFGVHPQADLVEGVWRVAGQEVHAVRRSRRRAGSDPPRRGGGTQPRPP